MARRPRIEYSGALYHVTARGVQRSAIFHDDHDRRDLLRLLARTLKTGDAEAFAYCLMGNHYHVVLQTHEANLSTLMHRINAAYSQAFNRRHARCGHVLEGRFQAIPIDLDSHLLEVCRYVDLNPVRAGLAGAPGEWRWSSYRAHVGRAPPAAWLATKTLLGILTGLTPGCDEQVELAQERYADWVAAATHARPAVLQGGQDWRGESLTGPLESSTG